MAINLLRVIFLDSWKSEKLKNNKFLDSIGQKRFFNASVLKQHLLTQTFHATKFETF